MMPYKIKIAFLLLAVCMVCAHVRPYVLGALWRGAGTAENPYRIETAEQLLAIPPASKDYFKLSKDIDLKNYPNAIIVGSFSGTFDGDNHKITNFRASNISSSNVLAYALFPMLLDGTIKNLVVEHPNIECLSYGGSVSILVGVGWGNSKIENCHVIGGEITRNQNASPIVGIITTGENTLITKCSSSLSLTNRKGDAYGISGDGGKIENCFVTGTIWAHENAYGIASNAIVTNCYFAGQLFASNVTVGISQYQPHPYITKKPEDMIVTTCYFDRNLLPITTPSSQARSTAQMFTKSNYEGWNFDTIWGIEEGKGYPYLRSAK